RFYAYSVAGPAPQGRFEWHCFDPDKILLDPYAKSAFFPPTFDRAAASHPGSNAGKAPLGLLAGAGEVFNWSGDRRPRHQSDTIIYELHVRGFTINPNSGASPERRGTFAGLVEKIPYLKDLGITAVELMPIFQFDPQEGNYWGYNPLSFFAPHHGYGSRPGDYDQHNAFRAMVKALHAADIEVILDVVYNHTAEGDQRGPVYSYKGIDNSTYYLMSGRPGSPYENFSGTGNTLHCSNRFVRKMIVDSLRYWVKNMHVDGFRFDLFPDDRMHAFHPYQSVNYVTCHDGFTLYDLVSYDRKRNHANGHNNTDGPEESYSWNCGWEGDNGTPAEVLQLRQRQAKNFCCLLLLANGTPMLRAGDEFLQTQGGNNNPYNQDNGTTWLDWDRLRVNQDDFRFFRCMIRFRKAHPSLGRSRFWRDDVRWYGTGPTVDMGPSSCTLAVYLRG